MRAIRRGRSRHRAPSVRSTVAGFVLASLAALALLVGGGILVLREVGRREAVDDARRSAALVGQGIVEPELTDALLAGRPDAVARMDRVVQERVLGDRIARVKLWTPGGRIVYSDEPRLIGRPLRPRRRRAGDAAHGRRPGRGERPHPAREPLRARRGAPARGLPAGAHALTGRQLLFEAYQREDSITASGARSSGWPSPRSRSARSSCSGSCRCPWPGRWPGGCSGARRTARRSWSTRSRRRRSERRRIAGDLHDGVVQDLAGLSYRLAAAAGRADAAADPEPRRTRSGAAPPATREGVRRLRSLVVDLHPANLHAEGLAAALEDLAAPLRADGRRGAGRRRAGTSSWTPRPRRCSTGARARRCATSRPTPAPST